MHQDTPVSHLCAHTSQAYALRRAADPSGPLPPPAVIAEALVAQPLTSQSPRIIIEPPSSSGASCAVCYVYMYVPCAVDQDRRAGAAPGMFHVQCFMRVGAAGLCWVQLLLKCGPTL